MAKQGTITSFLSSYIAPDPAKPGKFKVVLGPREVIYLFELYATDPKSSGYDAQDIVVVVNFKDVE